MATEASPSGRQTLEPLSGRFRVGSGVKEQLWALLEFMEEASNYETERIFCATDVAHTPCHTLVFWQTEARNMFFDVAPNVLVFYWFG